LCVTKCAEEEYKFANDETTMSLFWVLDVHNHAMTIYILTKQKQNEYSFRRSAEYPQQACSFFKEGPRSPQHPLMKIVVVVASEEYTVPMRMEQSQLRYSRVHSRMGAQGHPVLRVHGRMWTRQPCNF